MKIPEIIQKGGEKKKKKYIYTEHPIWHRAFKRLTQSVVLRRQTGFISSLWTRSITVCTWLAYRVGFAEEDWLFNPRFAEICNVSKPPSAASFHNGLYTAWARIWIECLIYKYTRFICISALPNFKVIIIIQFIYLFILSKTGTLKSNWPEATPLRRPAANH